jgi:hypothetical protein
MGEEVTGEWLKLYNEEPDDVHEMGMACGTKGRVGKCAHIYCFVKAYGGTFLKVSLKLCT